MTTAGNEPVGFGVHDTITLTYLDGIVVLTPTLEGRESGPPSVFVYRPEQLIGALKKAREENGVAFDFADVAFYGRIISPKDVDIVSMVVLQERYPAVMAHIPKGQVEILLGRLESLPELLDVPEELKSLRDMGVDMLTKLYLTSLTAQDDSVRSLSRQAAIFMEVAMRRLTDAPFTPKWPSDFQNALDLMTKSGS